MHSIKNNRCFTGALLLGACLLCSLPTFAQKVISKSEKQRPAWLANGTPKPSNTTFAYKVIEGEHPNLDEARGSCLFNLSTYIGRTYDVDGKTVTHIEKTESTETENYRFDYTIKGAPCSLTSRKEDEYWEYQQYPNGDRVYRCYTLYAVAASPSVANFDELRFTRKYGARGLVRSMIVPGWGQMYKGSMAKGGCILGGEVALVAGIIVSENLRVSYSKKIKNNPEHAKTYYSKMDNSKNIRNICIGGAAALYVYNLVDAIVANGRKRTVVSRKHQFVMAPVASPDCSGIMFSCKF